MGGEVGGGGDGVFVGVFVGFFVGGFVGNVRVGAVEEEGNEDARVVVDEVAEAEAVVLGFV